MTLPSNRLGAGSRRGLVPGRPNSLNPAKPGSQANSWCRGSSGRRVDAIRALHGHRFPERACGSATTSRGSPRKPGRPGPARRPPRQGAPGSAAARATRVVTSSGNAATRASEVTAPPLLANISTGPAPNAPTRACTSAACTSGALSTRTSLRTLRPSRDAPAGPGADDLTGPYHVLPLVGDLGATVRRGRLRRRAVVGGLVAEGRQRRRAAAHGGGASGCGRRPGLDVRSPAYAPPGGIKPPTKDSVGDLGDERFWLGALTAPRQRAAHVTAACAVVGLLALATRGVGGGVRLAHGRARMSVPVRR